MSTINIGGGNKSSASFKLGDTIGESMQALFTSSGFHVKAGFQYIHPLVPFSFRISDLQINFGTLSPNTPVTRQNTLYVTTGSAYGYQVKTIENHPLQMVASSVTIPDTSCDLSLTCSITTATPWTSASRYGFGYNISGTDVDTAQFVNSNYYRPFPIEGVDSPAVIMSRTGIATGSAAIVTYKANISGSQAAGDYQNAIQFFAIPSF